MLICLNTSEFGELANSRELFYTSQIKKFINNRNSSILIVGGGNLDKYIFENSGYTNVTISNIDTRMNSNSFLPYKWEFQSMENLQSTDYSFDYVVTHAALHHCAIPHKALTEMYRVARKGILCFESRDSLTMRIMISLGLIPSYEHTAVYFNECKYGGKDNTEIPNFIFRWTERDVEKCINTFAPEHKHLFDYEYGLAIPASLQYTKRGKITILRMRILNIFVAFLMPAFRILFNILRNQKNLFCFFIHKPKEGERLHPWITLDKEDNSVRFNKNWAFRKFGQSNCK